MSDNLMDSIAPQLAPPVTREPIRSAAEADDDGAQAMIILLVAPIFADDAE